MVTKASKRVIELRKKEAESKSETKWEVKVPCGLEEFQIVEVPADGYTFEDDGIIVFWKGDHFEDGSEVAVFNEWIYAIRKPLV